MPGSYFQPVCSLHTADSSRIRSGRWDGCDMSYRSRFALIALLLYVSLRSWPLAALVLINLPFATVGGVIALWLRGLHLSVSASVGFIALFGVAVLNGLVLLSTVRGCVRCS